MMEKFIEKLIDGLREQSAYSCWQCMDEAIEVVCKIAEEYKGGWIPCSERLPGKPEENPVFENKPLELYLVTVNNTKYPFRAFWNGKFFTDGWNKVDAIAWMPLPEPYKEGGE